jgi:hypothetical protein
MKKANKEMTLKVIRTGRKHKNDSFTEKSPTSDDYDSSEGYEKQNGKSI